jgi:uncharacterized membrane protein YvbJ
MRFCTTCGKEGTPGKKFCEYCGAPFEQPDTVQGMSTPTSAVSAPVIPQTVAVKSAGGSGKTLAIGGIIVVLVLIAGIYFIGMPLIGGPQGLVQRSGRALHSQRRFRLFHRPLQQ